MVQFCLVMADAAFVDAQAIVAFAVPVAARWSENWSEFLEICRGIALDNKLNNKPWVCQCGTAVGAGSPHTADTRTGHSLWQHVLSNVGKAGHPGQDDIDRWEKQTTHKQWKGDACSKKKTRKWGEVNDLWPYMAALDVDSLRHVKSRIDKRLLQFHDV